MKFLPEYWKIYFKNSRTLLYSYLASLPLLLGYEILLFMSQPSNEQMVRISVDVWMQSFIRLMGVNATAVILLLVAIAGIFILYREREKFAHLRPVFFVYIIVESLVYAMVIGAATSTITAELTMFVSSGIDQLSYLQKLSLSLGAGLYEELFFRVILVSAAIYILKKFFRQKWLVNTLAILSAAVLFSLAHFTGSMGDPFTLDAFVFRLLFGIALNIIYIWRGFSVAAWTHALYDIFVITFA